MELKRMIEIIAPYIIHSLELIGIFIIVVGTIKAFGAYLKDIVNPDKNKIKIDFAESIALGIEFKLASEIIKTVLIKKMSDLYILGAVVLIRLVLTFAIDWEIKQYDKKKQNTNQQQGQNQNQSQSQK